MTEQALKLQGIDRAGRSVVRVELRLITDESLPGLPDSFSAPRGFLSREDIEAAKALTNRTAERAAGIEDLGRTGFRAPKGFIA